MARAGCPAQIFGQMAVIVAIMATKIAVAVLAALGTTAVWASELVTITMVYGLRLAEQAAWVCLKSAQMTNAGMN